MTLKAYVAVVIYVATIFECFPLEALCFCYSQIYIVITHYILHFVAITFSFNIYSVALIVTGVALSIVFVAATHCYAPINTFRRKDKHFELTKREI